MSDGGKLFKRDFVNRVMQHRSIKNEKRIKNLEKQISYLKRTTNVTRGFRFERRDFQPIGLFFWFVIFAFAITALILGIIAIDRQNKIISEIPELTKYFNQTK